MKKVLQALKYLLAIPIGALLFSIGGAVALLLGGLLMLEICLNLLV